MSRHIYLAYIDRGLFWFSSDLGLYLYMAMCIHLVSQLRLYYTLHTCAILEP